MLFSRWAGEDENSEWHRIRAARMKLLAPSPQGRAGKSVVRNTGCSSSTPTHALHSPPAVWAVSATDGYAFVLTTNHLFGFVGVDKIYENQRWVPIVGVCVWEGEWVAFWISTPSHLPSICRMVWAQCQQD